MTEQRDMASIHAEVVRKEALCRVNRECLCKNETEAWRWAAQVICQLKREGWETKTITIKFNGKEL